MNPLAKALAQFWKSSIGKKIVVGVTGAMLVLFLLGHLAGNLLIFQGREDLNEYAEFLHEMLHGWGVWIARIGLLAAFVLHIVATVALTRQNRAARENRYEFEETNVASKSSRIMIWSGLTVLAFVVFHILHFTVRIDPLLAGMVDPVKPERHDVYGMMHAGFRGFNNLWVVLFYVVGITLLCSHLSHGIASIFQTLGMRSEETRSTTHKLGLGISVLLWVGFLSIPVSIAVGLKVDETDPSSLSDLPPIEVDIEREVIQENALPPDQLTPPNVPEPAPLPPNN
ncbi:MAG: succinate dehydrogenase cytochrome b subunit [Verrucomicrobiales bacterium]|nr:succinate dehydrogenase cytochrome b subunit [Verrucomicrobiales bacterium]